MSVRTGIDPPAQRRRSLRTSAISGPGGIAAAAVLRARASARVISDTRFPRSALTSTTRAAVASSSATRNLPRELELEALVAAGGHVGAHVRVLVDPAEVRKADTRLAGNVGAHVPAVGARDQRLTRDVLDVLCPRDRRLFRWLDRLDPVLAHVAQAIVDPFDLLLDRHGHVRGHR